MFYLLFGQYLVERKLITESYFQHIKHKIQEASVKLGVIAVSEGLLTTSQAEAINRIQAGIDKRFGDIAMEKGYLTKGQIDNLLIMQGNTFLKFIQILIDEQKASLNDITEYLKDYQSEKGYTESQMAILRSGDFEEVLPIILRISDPMNSELICLTIRNLIRFIDPHVYVSKSVVTNEYTCENLAIQSAIGDHNIQLGFSGRKDSLLQIANIFADEEFEDIDADSYDAICEFINCINGLFATRLSENDINVDMLPPFYYTNTTLKCNNLVVVTVHFSDYSFDLILSIDSPIEYL